MDVSLKKLTENPVFRSYLFYTSVLALKMMIMTLLTIRQRFKNNAFVSDEDARFLGGNVSRTNENVERVRRGHLNDIETIYLFLLVSFAYIFTDPDPASANLMFFLFTAGRFLHTIVYTVVVTAQPARGLSWLVGYLIMGYMAFKTLVHFNH